MLQQEGIVITQPSMANISLIGYEKAELSNLISETFSLSNLSYGFPASASMITEGRVTDLAALFAGGFGFLYYIPEAFCVKGVLQGCAGSSVADGTAVRVCAPYTNASTGALRAFPSNAYISSDTATKLGRSNKIRGHIEACIPVKCAPPRLPFSLNIPSPLLSQFCFCSRLFVCLLVDRFNGLTAGDLI